MRTKTLAVCAALTAASALSAMAQSSNVYSLNIVGYANIPITPGNNFYANPFDNNGNNATNIFSLSPLDDNYSQPAGTMNSFYVLTWNGSGFNQVYYENDFTANNVGAGYAGWATDANPSAPAAPPVLSPGKGFIINNIGNLTTNTFVGNVLPSPGGTNSLPIGAGNSLIGSPLPVAGTGNATDGNGALPGPLSPVDDNYSQPAGTFNSFYILTWNGSGFNQVYYENDFTVNNVGPGYAGWATDANPSAPANPPSIKIGQGYFINNIGNATPWLQTLTNSP